MDDDLKKVSDHMLRLGLGALAHANWHAHYYSMENDQWSNLSVVQAAHAAEILIKARIAEEHPLLIFDQLPKASNDDELVTFETLLSEGRTVQYRDLPDRLWASTGIKIPAIDNYRDFGKTRNMVQHFAPPLGVDLSQRTLEFIFLVIDPFIHECWELCAIDFNEDHEPYTYFVPGIAERGIPFHVSADVIQRFEYTDFDWPDNFEHKKEMETRFSRAQANMKK